VCEVAGVSRAGYYRYFQDSAPKEAKTELQARMQQIALEHQRRYGYRRITAKLRPPGA